MTGEEKLNAYAQRAFPRKVTQVNERVYHFLGFGTSNAIAILGDSSVILVDALDSPDRGRALRRELEGLTPKPVKTLIYTHSHPDHLGGAGAFRDTVEEVIAFAGAKAPVKYYDKIQTVLNRRSRRQFGYLLSDEEVITEGIGPREDEGRGIPRRDILPPTTLYPGGRVERTIDGVKLTLMAAPGETDDQLYVWLEEGRVLCCGDNYYGCWPNLYAIRGTPYRDVSTWVEALDAILACEPEALLPGHTAPLLGWEVIREQVGQYRDAIEFVLLRTLECMDRGMTLEQTAAAVKLPEAYAQKDFLGEFYGTVEWTVRGIYTGYVGWFDGAPAHLMPQEEPYRAALAQLIGEERLVEKIRACLEQEEYQLALQLLELTHHPELEREALLGRAGQMTSANARHYLIASAKEL